MMQDGKMKCYNKGSKVLYENCTYANLYAYQAALLKSVAQAVDENNGKLTLSKEDIKQARKDTRGVAKRMRDRNYGRLHQLSIRKIYKGLKMYACHNDQALFHITPNFEIKYGNNSEKEAIKRAQNNYKKYNQK